MQCRRLKCLSKTELMVLQMVLEGLSSKQIARRMHRSVRTVEVHRQHIMQKLGATNLVHLVRLAMTEYPLLVESGAQDIARPWPNRTVALQQYQMQNT